MQLPSSSVGGALARSWQADIHGIDAKRLHQMKDANFFVDAGIVNGRILQSVAQRFVVQQDVRPRRD